jgi:hypothetical protein
MCRALVQALAHPSLTKFGNIIASEAKAPVDTISFWPGPTEQQIMLFQRKTELEDGEVVPHIRHKS